MKTFKLSDSYTVKDLVEYAYGHLLCAGHLFKENNIVYFDSAGVLAHIGIELFLKAWLLEIKGQHRDGHCLNKLYGEIIKSGVPDFLNDENIKQLEEIDAMFYLRYPPGGEPIEVGSDDWDKIDNIMSLIYKNLPDNIQAMKEELYVQSDGTWRKGGRITMRKPIDK